MHGFPAQVFRNGTGSLLATLEGAKVEHVRVMEEILHHLNPEKQELQERRSSCGAFAADRILK